MKCPDCEGGVTFDSCEDCDGTGEDVCEYCGRGDECFNCGGSGEREDECLTCHGSGEVDEESGTDSKPEVA